MSPGYSELLALKTALCTEQPDLADIAFPAKTYVIDSKGADVVTSREKQIERWLNRVHERTAQPGWPWFNQQMMRKLGLLKAGTVDIGSLPPSQRTLTSKLANFSVASTQIVNGKTHYIVDCVLENGQKWTVRKHYSEFAALRDRDTLSKHSPLVSDISFPGKTWGSEKAAGTAEARTTQSTQRSVVEPHPGAGVRVECCCGSDAVQV